MEKFKFRAWDNKGKCMLDWFCLTQTAFNRLDQVGRGLMYQVLTNQANANDDYGFVVMPYTVLKDRNGKDIYEGDLLAYPAANEWETENYAAFEVFYHDGDMAGSHIGFVMNRCHYKGSVCGTYIPSFKPSVVQNMEVIGNIYENPELLTQQTTL